MRIISIDPGYERLGIAVLEKNPGDKREALIYSDCFKTKASLPHHERLRLIGAELERVIGEYAPEALSAETLFFNSNQKTAMKVAEARGVILYAAAKAGLEIREYTPIQIKTAVSGYGGSGKAEMMKIVPLLVKIGKEIRHDDEYDAIAAGLAFFAYRRSEALAKEAE